MPLTQKDRDRRKRQRRQKKVKQLKQKIVEAKDPKARLLLIEKFRKLQPWGEIPEAE